MQHCGPASAVHACWVQQQTHRPGRTPTPSPRAASQSCGPHPGTAPCQLRSLKRGWLQRDLQKINRVYSFKGCRHRHFIVRANYQWKIITADGLRVTDFSYALHLGGTDDETRELSQKGKTSPSKRTLQSRWGPSKSADDRVERVR